jgi:hypothetical protein
MIAMMRTRAAGVGLAIVCLSSSVTLTEHLSAGRRVDRSSALAAGECAQGSARRQPD